MWLGPSSWLSVAAQQTRHLFYAPFLAAAEQHSQQDVCLEESGAMVISAADQIPLCRAVLTSISCCADRQPAYVSIPPLESMLRERTR